MCVRSSCFTRRTILRSFRSTFGVRKKKYGCGTHFKNMSGTGKAPVRKANDEEVRGGDSPVRNTQLFFLQYTCPLQGLASLFPGFFLVVILPSSFFLTVRCSSCQHTLRWMEGHPPIRISKKHCSMLRMISGSQQSIRVMEDRAPLPSTGSKGERELSSLQLPLP